MFAVTCYVCRISAIFICNSIYYFSISEFLIHHSENFFANVKNVDQIFSNNFPAVILLRLCTKNSKINVIKMFDKHSVVFIFIHFYFYLVLNLIKYTMNKSETNMLFRMKFEDTYVIATAI